MAVYDIIRGKKVAAVVKGDSHHRAAEKAGTLLTQNQRRRSNKIKATKKQTVSVRKHSQQKVHVYKVHAVPLRDPSPYASMYGRTHKGVASLVRRSPRLAARKA